MGTVKNVIKYARTGTAQSWQKVDVILRHQADNPDFIGWSLDNIGHDDPNMRDLALSILEQSVHKLSEAEMEEVKAAMFQDTTFASFRAACALAVRFERGELSDDNLSHQVIEKLKIFRDDPDVANIAQGYLDMFSTL